MIIVTARLESDAESLEKLQDAIAVMERASRAEPGCQDYTFSVEFSSPAVVRITERWDDRAALLAHFDTAHMSEFSDALLAHPPRKLEVHCFEAVEVPMPGREPTG